MPRIRIAAAWQSLRSSLWFVPSLMMSLAIFVSVGMIELDRRVQVIKSVSAWIYSGGPEGARQVLATIAGSMITVAGVSFSVTMVALSLASSQLGPRLLRNFMRDRGNQIVLGTFIATFIYCLLVLRTIRGDRGGNPEFVPSIAVTFGLVLAIASLAVLIYFIHHLTNLLQADHVIAAVADELDQTIAHMYPSGTGNEPRPSDDAAIRTFEELAAQHPSRLIESRASGYINVIALDDLLGIARSKDLVIRVPMSPGRHVLDHSIVAEVWPDTVDDGTAARIRQTCVLGRKRTADEDIEFAVDQIVEVAARALSPSLNDPFTAITCIDHLSTAMLHLIECDFPSPYRLDDQGVVRIIAIRPDFSGIADAAFNQLRQFGSRVPAVAIRMLEAIASLIPFVRTEEQKEVLMRHAAMIRRAARQETDESEDLADIQQRYRELR